MRPRKAVLTVLLLSFMFLFSACSKVDSQPASMGKAADFTLQTADGGSVTLGDVIKSKKAVLVFFATWCPYCVEEIPAINKFYAEHGNDAAVYGVNIQENALKVQAFIKDKGVTYPVALDKDGSAARAYNVHGIPELVVVGKDGNIIYRGRDLEAAAKVVTQ